jgi:hypothetical protein
LVANFPDSNTYRKHFRQTTVFELTLSGSLLTCLAIVIHTKKTGIPQLQIFFSNMDGFAAYSNTNS